MPDADAKRILLLTVVLLTGAENASLIGANTETFLYSGFKLFSFIDHDRTTKAVIGGGGGSVLSLELLPQDKIDRKKKINSPPKYFASSIKNKLLI